MHPHHRRLLLVAAVALTTSCGAHVAANERRATPPPSCVAWVDEHDTTTRCGTDTTGDAGADGPGSANPRRWQPLAVHRADPGPDGTSATYWVWAPDCDDRQVTLDPSWHGQVRTTSHISCDTVEHIADGQVVAVTYGAGGTVRSRSVDHVRYSDDPHVD